jgi:hypothetical protein
LQQKHQTQNGSVLTNNSSLNNDEKIPAASKSKSINGKLTSPYVPQKKKEKKILVVFFRDRYFRFITMKWTRIVLIPKRSSSGQRKNGLIRQVIFKRGSIYMIFSMK